MPREIPEQYRDLPEELQEQLRFSQQENLEENLINLFNDGRSRTINEVMVDYWRTYDRIIKRTTMASSLANLVRREKLRRAGKGVYKTTVNPPPPIGEQP